MGADLLHDITSGGRVLDAHRRDIGGCRLATCFASPAAVIPTAVEWICTRLLAAFFLVAALGIPAARLHAQTPADSTAVDRPAPRAGCRTPRATYWRRMAAGFATSILAHEAAHCRHRRGRRRPPHLRLEQGTAYGLLGARRGHPEAPAIPLLQHGAQRPGAPRRGDSRRAASGRRAFERGVLAGGIATALFYVTIGRTASVSDVTSWLERRRSPRGTSRSSTEGSP